MTDIANLEIRVDSTGAKKADKELGKLEKQSGKTERAVGGIAKGAKKGKKGLKGLETQSRKTEKASRGLASGAKAAGGAIAAYFTVKAAVGVIKTADAFNLLQKRVERLADNSGDAAAKFSALTSIAVETGSDMKGTVKLWENLDQTLSEFGKSDVEVLQLTESLSKLGVIGGSSIDELKFSMRQFGQAMAGGVMRGEEFNSIIENTPEIARAMARGMDKTMGEMRMAMLDGELTAEVVFDALMSQTDDVNTEFGKMPRTIDMASSALSTNFGNAVASLDKTIGASSSLVMLIDFMSGEFEGPGEAVGANLQTVIDRLDIGIEKKKKDIQELQKMSNVDVARKQAGYGYQKKGPGSMELIKNKKIAEANQELERIIWQREKLAADLKALDLDPISDEGDASLKKVDAAGVELVTELEKRKEKTRQAGLEEIALLDEKQAEELDKLKTHLAAVNITKKQYDEAEQSVRKHYEAEKTKVTDKRNDKIEKELAKELATKAEASTKSLEGLKSQLDSEEKQVLDSYNRRSAAIDGLSLTQQEITAAGFDNEKMLRDNYHAENLNKLTEQNESILEQKREQAAQEIEIENEKLLAIEEANKTSLQRFIDDAREKSETFEGMWGNTFNNFTSSFGNAVADSIVDGEDFGDTMDVVAKGFAKSMIAAMVEIAAQKMVLWALEQTIGAAGAASNVAAISSQASTQVVMAGLNAFTSTAAIPIVGPLMAPAAAATATGIAAPMAAAAIAAASAGIAARSHGGQVMGGSSYLVGEFGPEVLNMPGNSAGSITPNHKIGADQKEIQPQWTVIVNEAPPGTDVNIDEQNKIIEIAVAQTKNELHDDFTRGGPLRRSLGR